ncbi:sugar ABC transporter substrate-binding protein [Conexibacter woesei]|uniref:ABC-type sugar transport system periplasmic component-like protein n=1 Tax=Conexibacter woesei (strain DSM 14684 / CCUG 47730 / CIP 108061 / JCM 11494 / NBRC 100937 / ID131577) TaxID=469383 RepID=D3F5H4_CONWI|nr:sugar ABC transporter substrate-binding protein [Conexibacter woesei]ADB50641.1 ABC-type sugar transport system periplasmic component-like protein [Conexibacter woesei DSM 14684]
MRAQRMRAAVAATVAIAVAGSAVGCGSSEDGGSTAGSATTAERPRVAFVNASMANAVLQAAYQEMQRVAEAEGVELTAFDAGFDPAKQFAQLQDVVASGQYDGVIVAPLDGNGLVPGVEAAIDAGLKVGSLNQAIGSRLDTTEPQVDGMSFAVIHPPVTSGRDMGRLTVEACRDVDPCEVGFLYGSKALPLGQALRQGWDGAVEDSPNIEVVAEGDGNFDAQGGLKVVQDFLQAHPGIDVIVGPDPSVVGAQPALSDAGRLGKVKLVGGGGSAAAIRQIAAGENGWVGTAVVLPRSEGRAAMEAMIAAVRDGKASGGIDPSGEIPGGAMLTRENAARFRGEFPS